MFAVEAFWGILPRAHPSVRYSALHRALVAGDLTLGELEQRLNSEESYSDYSRIAFLQLVLDAGRQPPILGLPTRKKLIGTVRTPYLRNDPERFMLMCCPGATLTALRCADCRSLHPAFTTFGMMHALFHHDHRLLADLVNNHDAWKEFQHPGKWILAQMVLQRANPAAIDEADLRKIRLWLSKLTETWFVSLQTLYLRREEWALPAECFPLPISYVPNADPRVRMRDMTWQGICDRMRMYGVPVATAGWSADVRDMAVRDLQAQGVPRAWTLADDEDLVSAFVECQQWVRNQPLATHATFVTRLLQQVLQMPQLGQDVIEASLQWWFSLNGTTNEANMRLALLAHGCGEYIQMRQGMHI